jgi:hypothetical protein
MALSQSQSYKKIYYWLMLRSFLIWTFTLAVCLLIVGFPLVILMVTVGSLLAITLQSILPMSSVLLVAGSLFGINILAIMMGAAALTLHGIHPEDVDWLRWLHGEANPNHTSVFASCPLTCDVQH